MKQKTRLSSGFLERCSNWRLYCEYKHFCPRGSDPQCWPLNLYTILDKTLVIYYHLQLHFISGMLDLTNICGTDTKAGRMWTIFLQLSTKQNQSLMWPSTELWALCGPRLGFTVTLTTFVWNLTGPYLVCRTSDTNFCPSWPPTLLSLVCVERRAWMSTTTRVVGLNFYYFTDKRFFLKTLKPRLFSLV